ncbi:MAG: glycosyltransferase family 4 protein [Chloroflexi bacterium]|nr:glycosyltransferase family 4 protein [Chloroflexota bacterium]
MASVFWPIYPGFGGRHAYALAGNLVEAGYEVDVVAAFPIDLRRRWNFFRQWSIAKDKSNGMRVFRVFSLIPTGLGLIRKLLFYLSFALTSLIAIPFIRKADYVLALHPPPAWLILPGFVFSRLLRAKYIIRVTDLWPDVVFEFKLANRTPLRQLVKLMAKITYGMADQIMAFTPEIKARMVKSGVPENKISIVEMAVDTITFSPESLTAGEAGTLGLPESNEKFVVLYAGAFALTYDFDALLKAAKILENERIVFVILGDGDAKNQITQTIKKLNLKNVIMAPPVAGAQKVAKCINYSDVCVMPLKPEMLTSTITRPSKVFEFWACGKPVVSCTKGEMEHLTNESGAGIVVEPGDVEGLATAIKRLYQNPDETNEMGKRAREYVTSRFSYESLQASLVSTLAKVK